MRKWGWSNTQGHLGKKSLPMWLRSLSSAVPWITMLVLFLMIVKLQGVFLLDKGTLIDLPEGAGDISKCHGEVLVLNTDEGVLLFFDGSRYMLNNSSQMHKFSQHLFENMSYIPTTGVKNDINPESVRPTLFMLIDNRVSVSDQMSIVRIAKMSGVERIMIAERKERLLKE